VYDESDYKHCNTRVVNAELICDTGLVTLNRGLRGEPKLRGHKNLYPAEVHQGGTTRGTKG